MFRYSPFDQMFQVIRDVDALFRRMIADSARHGELTALPAGTSRALTSGSTGGSSVWENAFLPSVESFTRGDQLVFRAELPGVDPSAVDVSLVGNMLTLRGEKRQDRLEDRDRLHLQETVHGRFERSFQLPDTVKPEDVKASYRNGVLEITLPVPAATKVHRIQIAGGDEQKKIKAA